MGIGAASVTPFDLQRLPLVKISANCATPIRLAAAPDKELPTADLQV